MTLNYAEGAPGSYLSLSGDNFPANSLVKISVNEKPIGTATTDASGHFNIIINTQNADEGYYVVKATANPTARTRFTLRSELPVRAKEGEAAVYPVPAGIAYQAFLYLPMAKR